MRWRLLTVMAAALLATFVHTGSAAPAGRPRQILQNPFFTEWSSAKPVGWSVLGSPDVWWTDSLHDAQRSVQIVANAEGDGLMQRVAVEPGQRYYVRAWTGVRSGAGELLVRAVGGDVLFRAAIDGPWLQERAAFFTPRSAQIDVVVASTRGGGALFVDKLTVAPVRVDPTPALVAVPAVPVFYASADLRWVDALPAINVVSSGSGDVGEVARLRKRGVLCLPTVQTPGRGQPVTDAAAAADALLAHWMRPFHETHEGTIPGGADGVIIDELEAFEDDAPRLAVWEIALAELRRLYPSRVIAVWGSGAIGTLNAEGEPRRRVMAMLDACVDLFMIEIYQATCPLNREPAWVTGKRSYGRDLPAYAEAARVIGLAQPSLLPKTVVCLVTAQNVGMNYDIDAEHNFIEWLRVQMTRIPRFGRDGPIGFGGIGHWVSYRARATTLVAFGQHARDIFLAPDPPQPLDDADCVQPVRDPNFEAQPSAWTFYGPDSGRRSLVRYADSGLPDVHDRKVEHFLHHVQLQRGGAAGGVRQTVALAPDRDYTVSVYALPMSARAAAHLRVRTAAGDRVLTTASEPLHQPSRWWVRLSAGFRAPADGGAVTIELTDAACAAGASVAYDWVDVAPMAGLNRPLAVEPAPPVRLADLPRSITLRGRNFTALTVVRLGADVYASVRFISPQELEVRVPQLHEAGDYDLTVRREDWLGTPQVVTLAGGLRVAQ